ncbi:MAG TPA: Na+/H+ antiporter subunit E [Castellaniella sp.]|uniref:Na+/H+ antiporter subunit E n=1 Tax=Castellaniella sp. TaxID=1955812 RepID=UPI002F0EF247
MKFLRRTLPLTVLLLILWLTLNDSIGTGQWLLGLVIAFTLALLTPLLRPVRAQMRRPGAALRLIGRVAADVVRSNGAVAWRIVRGNAARAHPGFLKIPLRLQDPHGLAALSCIVTFTPGTVWAGHDAHNNQLTLHVLDLRHADQVIFAIQERYERLLLEIFE